MQVWYDMPVPNYDCIILGNLTTTFPLQNLEAKIFWLLKVHNKPENGGRYPSYNLNIS